MSENTIPWTRYESGKPQSKTLSVERTTAYHGRRHRIKHNVLEPRVHVVQYEQREQHRGVYRARLDDEHHHGPQLGMSEREVVPVDRPHPVRHQRCQT